MFEPLNSRIDAIIKSVSVSLISLFLINQGFAQDLIDSSRIDLSDPLTIVIPTIDSNNVRQVAEAYGEESLEQFADRQAHSIQMKKLADLRQKYADHIDYFRRGIDSSGYNKEFNKLAKDHTISLGGFVPPNLDTIVSSRNLTVSEVLIRELRDRLMELRDEVNDKYAELLDLRIEIDSLSADTSLYLIPEDSLLFEEYWYRVNAMNETSNEMYLRLNSDIESLGTITIRVDTLQNSFTNDIRDLALVRLILAGKTGKKMMPAWFEPSPRADSIPEVLYFSAKKNKLVFSYYIRNNRPLIGMFGGVILLVTFFLRGFRRRLRDILRENGEELTGVVKRPLLISTFVLINLGQFFFTQTPFVFQALLWIAACLILSNLVVPRWSWKQIFLWIGALLVFVIAIVVNLLLKASDLERYILAAISLLSILLGSIYWLKPVEIDRGARWFRFAILLMILLEIGSLGTNTYGSYNLAKLLGVAGVFLVVTAVLLYWTVQLIREVLQWGHKYYQLKGEEVMSQKMENVTASIPGLLYHLLIVGWLYLFSHNFYVQHFIDQVVNYLLSTERHLGEYSFTISSILTFVLIIAFSVLLAKVISFFTSRTRWDQPAQDHSDLSNWLLLIRISVVGAGILLAFLAAGTPLDRLSLIIGSLGVGIGFGLQSIVNNLFSGIIIAFERPFHIGDQIEVGSMAGTVKEIGIRSSKIKTYDGSDVIVPNGDLLNEHLVNWTLSDRHRRADLTVGVAYGSDLKKVKELALQILQDHPMVLNTPPPGVLLKELNSSSIDFRLLFWTDVDVRLGVENDVMFTVDQVLAENGIEIPFPQMDVHISRED